MIKKSVFFIVLLGTLFSCSDTTKEKSELLSRIDSLNIENQKKEKDISEMMSFINVLADGLDSIAKQEDILFNSNKGREGFVVDREQLKKNLDAFENILNQQNEKIAQLADSLKARGENLNKLQVLVDYLNSQLDEKNRIISSLRADLENNKVNIANLQKKVRSLSESNTELASKVETQSTTLAAQTEIINECYVKIGNKKTLSALGIITGGLLKKTKINPNAINQSQFTKVDIRYFTKVPLQSSKPVILTQMPSSSYKIEKTGKNSSILYIVDPTAFWSLSNYLVILLK
jgi:DNA repair exonuclease SbcCD ATPase subunit